MKSLAGGPSRMDPHTLVDRGKVVEHPVRLIDFVLQISECIVSVLARDPESWDSVGGGLSLDRGCAQLLLQLLRAIAGCGIAGVGIC